ERFAATTPVTCVDSEGNQTGLTSQAPYTLLHYLSGSDGAKLYTFGSPIPDFCWANGGAPSLYPQWTTLSVIADARSHAFAISPYYATQSWIFKRAASGQVSVNALIFPSSATYETTYPGAQIVIPGTTLKHVPNSHVFNGV